MRKSAIFVVLTVCLAAPVSAASAKRQESCRITAEIVEKAVEARIDGKTPQQAKTALRAEGSGITGIYKATIPTLVDMVYGFDESTLGEEAVSQYETECLSF